MFLYQHKGNKANFTLIDAYGRTMMSQDLQGKQGLINTSVANLQSGMYYFTVHADGNIYQSGKLILKTY